MALTFSPGFLPTSLLLPGPSPTQPLSIFIILKSHLFSPYIRSLILTHALHCFDHISMQMVPITVSLNQSSPWVSRHQYASAFCSTWCLRHLKLHMDQTGFTVPTQLLALFFLHIPYLMDWHRPSLLPKWELWASPIDTSLLSSCLSTVTFLKYLEPISSPSPIVFPSLRRVHCVTQITSSLRLPHPALRALHCLIASLTIVWGAF